MTWPAADVPSLPLSRMRRVEATFRESLKRVTVRRIEGKAEKSRGFKTYMDISMMMMEMVMLNDSMMSRASVGIGTIITIRTPMTATAIMVLEFFIHPLKGLASV